jgi:hypothetical protein
VTVSDLQKELDRVKWENCWLLQRNMELEARLKLLVATFDHEATKKAVMERWEGTLKKLD